MKAIVKHLRWRAPALDLPIDVQATAFQWKVWRALQAIPYGETRAYAEVARAIGQPPGRRAVARACATNPVAVVVPCHRVVADRRRAWRLPVGRGAEGEAPAEGSGDGELRGGNRPGSASGVGGNRQTGPTSR